MHGDSLRTAIEAWTEALGPQFVIRAPEALEAHSRDTGSRISKILAVLRPVSQEDVIALVRIAQAHKVPVYPSAPATTGAMAPPIR